MANWRNKIEIKNMFNDDDSDEIVLKVLERLIPQLKSIYTKENEKSKNRLDDDFLAEFEELIDEFIWVQESIKDDSEDPGDYGFNTWCDAFNANLESLFDMGDTTISPKTRDFMAEKFLWVG